MKEYEKEIISTIKSLVINGVKGLDGYNNPFKNVANALIMEHEKVYQWKMNDGQKELCDEKGNKIPRHKIPFGLYIEYAEVEVK